VNFSNVSPSHGLQLFTDCPSVSPFHGVQSFRNRLHQRGSPTGSQALSANLLWHGLLSLWVLRTWQQPAPAPAPHEFTASFRHPPALAWGPAWAASGYLLHRGPPWAAEGQPASPWSSPQAAGESLLQSLEHLLPLVLHRPWCLQSCFSHISSCLMLQLCRVFSPFLSMLSQRRYHRRRLAWPWPVVGPSWHWPALAPSDMGEASSSFTQEAPL